MLLPVNQLIDIISSEELNVQSEELVFNAVMAWVRHNVAERRQHLSAVSDYTCHASVAVICSAQDFPQCTEFFTAPNTTESCKMPQNYAALQNQLNEFRPSCSLVQTQLWYHAVIIFVVSILL